MKVIANVQIKESTILFTKENINFIAKKRYDIHQLIDEIYAFFEIKYKKKAISTNDINSYEHATWCRFEDKRKTIETIYEALKEGMTVTISPKEHYFLFEEKPKLNF